MNNGRTLVRSSLLMATATVPLLGATSAFGAVTPYFDQGTFESAAAGGGLGQLYVETFQENNMTGPYAIFGGPLTSGVPNGPFTTGLDAPGLSVDVGGSMIAINAYAEGGWYSHITSDVVGGLQGFLRTTMTFDGGVAAVGFDAVGNQTFIDGYFDLLDYVIYDTGGGVLSSGSLAASGSAINFFGAVSDGALIGSVEVWGTQWGLDTVEYVDNVQAWNIPAPGALALLGLAGLARRRRRA